MLSDLCKHKHQTWIHGTIKGSRRNNQATLDVLNQTENTIEFGKKKWIFFINFNLLKKAASIEYNTHFRLHTHDLHTQFSLQCIKKQTTKQYTVR